MSNLAKIDLDILKDFSQPKAPALIMNNLHLEDKTSRNNISEHDLTQAYKDGETNGYAKALSQFEVENADKQNALLERIFSTLQTTYVPIQKEIEKSQEIFKETIIEVVSEFIQQLHIKFLPQTLERLIHEVHETVLSKTTTSKKITICLHPTDLQVFDESIFQKLEKTSSDIQFIFKAIETVSQGDCFIEWQDNTVRFNTQDMIGQVRKHIDIVYNNNRTQEAS